MGTYTLLLTAYCDKDSIQDIIDCFSTDIININININSINISFSINMHYLTDSSGVPSLRPIVTIVVCTISINTI